MKNFRKKLVFGNVLVLAVALSAFTCEDDPFPVSGDQIAQEMTNSMRSGTWKITYYYDTDQEETTDFSGYNFTFGTGNVLTASNGKNTYTGNWSVANSDSSNDDDDNESDNLDFNIAFDSPEKFQELTDDWDVIERSATVIKLRDVSGGNGGTDYLTFNKN